MMPCAVCGLRSCYHCPECGVHVLLEDHVTTCTALEQSMGGFLTEDVVKTVDTTMTECARCNRPSVLPQGSDLCQSCASACAETSESCTPGGIVSRLPSGDEWHKIDPDTLSDLMRQVFEARPTEDLWVVRVPGPGPFFQLLPVSMLTFVV